MSFQLLNQAWKVRGLKHVPKMVLVRLADMADTTEGKCWPGHDTLADDCEASGRSIGDAIKALVADGHITVKEISKRGRKGNSRFEYLVHPKPTPATPSTVTPERASSVTPETGDADTGNPQRRHRNSATPTPEMASAPIYRTTNNHHRTIRGTEAPPASELANLKDWQLEKDSRALAAEIGKLEDAQNPDRELIRAKRASLVAYHGEIKRRAPVPKLKTTTAPVRRGAQQATPDKPLCESFTPAGKQAAAALSMLRETL